VGNYKAMISLVGEQPIANLLPVLCLQPQHVVLVCTDQTELVGRRLCSVLQEQTTEHNVSTLCEIMKVDPHDLVGIETEVRKFIGRRAWTSEELAFNLCGWYQDYGHCLLSSSPVVWHSILLPNKQRQKQLGA
jgi:hypothetical protein